MGNIEIIGKIEVKRTLIRRIKQSQLKFLLSLTEYIEGMNGALFKLCTLRGNNQNTIIFQTARSRLMFCASIKDRNI